MIFVKKIIRKTKRNINQRKQNENSKKTEENYNIRRNYANKQKKKQK